ncbi:MAG: cupredoxin domain-containing protein [Acidimicrobiales bacterium]
MDTTASDAPSVDTASAPVRGTAVATLGLLMAASGPLLLLVASIAFGLTESVGYFLIPVVLGLAGVWLVRLDRTWAKVVAIVLAVVVLSFAFWTVFGLGVPSSFFDFVPGTLVVPGVLLAIYGSVMAIRARRSGRTVGPGERRFVAVTLAVLGVLAVASVVLTLTGRDTVPDAVADEADAVVHLEGFEYDQDGYELVGGGTVLVENDDPFVHNFTIDALHIDVDLGPGSEKLIDIPDEPGTYVVYCEPHTEDTDDPGEDDMASELTIG